MTTPAGGVSLGGQPVNLTPIEYHLPYQLTKNAGKVVPHRILLGRVWGRDFLEETQYLKVYV